MNISAIHSGIFYKKNNVQNTRTSLPQALTNTSGLKLPSAPVADTVSFKRAPSIQGSPFVHDPRELELHCACCNKKMLKNTVVQKFMDDRVYFPAYIALDKIKYEQNFRLKEQPFHMQRAYSFIKNEANKHKNMNMDELLQTERVTNYRRNNSKAQYKALGELRDRCRTVTHNIDYLVNEIDKLHPDFQSTEAAVFQELKIYSKMYPTESIYNIFTKPEIREYYLVKLQNKQNAKLRKITPLIQQLSPQYAKRANHALDQSYRIFNNESSDIMHKRQRVIDLFERALAPMPFETPTDRPVADLIMKRLESLPDSKNDANAFIVKYAPRGSNKFVEVLVKRLRNTKEHVKPQHREGDNGESDKKNYIYLCGKCNHERKTQKYDEFIEKHPQMPQNTQKQIDEICDFINQGILDGYDTWPNDIKEPLGEESEGLIIIDTNRLNLEQARKNRSIKLEQYIEEQKRTAQTPDTLMTGPYRRHGKKKF